MRRYGWGDGAVQNVIEAVELARGFDRQDVVWFFYYTDGRGVSRCIAAVVAELSIADVIALGAEREVVFYV